MNKGTYSFSTSAIHQRAKRIHAISTVDLIVIGLIISSSVTGIFTWLYWIFGFLFK